MLKSNHITWILVIVLTFLVSFASHFLLFSLGLILIEFLLYPLALGISALVTALTATFLGNFLLSNEQHTPPRPVVMACEGIAAVLAILLIILNAANLTNWPPIFIIIPTTLLLSTTALIAVKRHRSDQPAAANERKQVFLWIVIAIIAIPLVVFVASLLGWASA